MPRVQSIMCPDNSPLFFRRFFARLANVFFSYAVIAIAKHRVINFRSVDTQLAGPCVSRTIKGGGGGKRACRYAIIVFKTRFRSGQRRYMEKLSISGLITARIDSVPGQITQLKVTRGTVCVHRGFRCKENASPARA